jgi:UDP-glucose 4-epimerase
MNGDYGTTFDLRYCLVNIDCIVHAAGRAHIHSNSRTQEAIAIQGVNVAGTLTLARQAAEVGVKRFIFLSSIKVNGESTGPGIAFSADDEPAPTDLYGVTKWKTEQGLMAIAASTGMDIVIVRPPLVYGPGVRANFHSMMKLLYVGVPMPLGRVDNLRSLVALDNLIDLLVTCVTHSAAANQTFLVSDDEDLSTTELLSRLARALGKRPQLISIPPSVLRFAARAIRMPGLA